MPLGGLIQLNRGLNLVSWLGSGGVSLAEVARAVGPGLLTIWTWDFEQQSYAFYSPRLPARFARFALSTGSGLWVSVDRPIAWRQMP